MYPLKFAPIYKEMLWGSESWDVSCRENEMSIVSNGDFEGMKFIDVISKNPKAYLGSKLFHLDEFPLLVKTIETNDKLSVQVHPCDDYAKIHENGQAGKTELWYVLDAPDNGYVIAGLNVNVTKEDFLKALLNGTAEICLETLPIKRGDVIFVPPGLIHAIPNDVMVVEIQQNSNITYRVYDYERKGLDGKSRELHIDKAFDVIDASCSASATPGLEVKRQGVSYTYYVSNPYFSVIKCESNGSDWYAEFSDSDRFHLFTCVDGECIVDSAETTVNVKKGDSFFIPAALGEYSIKGNCSLIKSFMPDTQNDFIPPLIEYGYSIDEIIEKTNIILPSHL